MLIRMSLYNFHVFVTVSTIIYYIVLKSFRGSLNPNKSRRKQKESKLAYVLFLPLVLYACYYLFIIPKTPTRSTPTVLGNPANGGNPGSSIDSAPFPPSNSFSVSV